MKFLTWRSTTLFSESNWLKISMATNRSQCIKETGRVPNQRKKRRILHMLLEGKVDICLLQESKTQKVGDDLIRSIWGIEDFEWSAIAARGQSGGIITIWRKDVVNPKFSFMGDGYLGINCLWKGLNCCIMNFYSSCNNLVKVKSNFPVGEWLLGGDFNATKLEEERKGKGRANSSEMANFCVY